MKSLKESILSSTDVGKAKLLVGKYKCTDFGADLNNIFTFLFDESKLNKQYEQCPFKEDVIDFNFNNKWTAKSFLELGKKLVVYIMNGKADFSDFEERMKLIVYYGQKLPSIEEKYTLRSGGTYVSIKTPIDDFHDIHFTIKKK